MPAKNNCKDLLIFCLHSQIPRGTFRAFGVLRFGASTTRKFRVPGMFERESQLVLGTAIWHIARVVPSFNSKSDCESRTNHSHHLLQEGVCLEGLERV
jgi:hypothetical protein